MLGPWAAAAPKSVCRPLPCWASSGSKEAGSAVTWALRPGSDTGQGGAPGSVAALPVLRAAPSCHSPAWPLSCPFPTLWWQGRTVPQCLPAPGLSFRIGGRGVGAQNMLAQLAPGARGPAVGYAPRPGARFRAALLDWRPLSTPSQRPQRLWLPLGLAFSFLVAIPFLWAEFSNPRPSVAACPWGPRGSACRAQGAC